MYAVFVRDSGLKFELNDAHVQIGPEAQAIESLSSERNLEFSYSQFLTDVSRHSKWRDGGMNGRRRTLVAFPVIPEYSRIL